MAAPVAAPQIEIVDPAYAVAGMLATTANIQVDSYTADTALPAGVVVCTGAVARAAGQCGSCKLPAASTDITAHMLGIVIWQPMHEPVSGSLAYAAGDTVPVLRVGEIWCLAEAALTNDLLAVFAVYSTANFGQLRADANTNKAAQIPYGIRIKVGSAGAGIVQVILNAP